MWRDPMDVGDSMNKYVVQYTYQYAGVRRPVLSTIRMVSVSPHAAQQDAWPVLRGRHPDAHIAMRGVVRL
ncbi:conserved hypothetical protein [Paraburkholderia tropica]|nr:conserved hypothetical protein [Paraburkholderia tropica]